MLETVLAPAGAELFTPGRNGQIAEMSARVRGVLARRDLFLPGGEMALRMAKNPTVLQVGDTVFAHAGIDMRAVEYGFQALNDDVAAWIAEFHCSFDSDDCAVD